VINQPPIWGAFLENVMLNSDDTFAAINKAKLDALVDIVETINDNDAIGPTMEDIERIIDRMRANVANLRGF
jgi:hypothetical protein